MPDATMLDAAKAGAPETREERTLVIERVLKASPDKVFAAWTDPATLVKWWGPEGFTTPECALDLRPGGAWRTVMLSPTGERHPVSGVYRELTPPSRLVMSWAWDQPDGSRGHETEVAITLEPVAGGTRMRLVQSLFQTMAWRDNHHGGWSSSFNRLEKLFA